MALPTVMTTAGLQPQSPTSLRSQLVSSVSATNPGYTANLPGSLIEDICSTDVGGVVICDQARVELVNSLTPYGANQFLLNQLGQIYGVPLGQQSNASVYVVFSGPPGFVFDKGFMVSDGTNQYALTDGGVIAADGSTSQLYALATTYGTWAIPANSVTQLVTSVPTGYAITVTNPGTGTLASSAQTPTAYRSQVLQAGLAIGQGIPSLLFTALQNVTGVVARLTNVVMNESNQWEVICGGGDPYQVAYAIYSTIFDFTNIAGSVLLATGITNANPGVVTTALNHGYATGNTVTIASANPSAFNGTYTVTVITEKTFSLGVDTTSFGAYVGSGVLTPNSRNITASVTAYPNTYPITFVNPPQQSVKIVVTWNTTSTNVVSNSAISQLATPEIIAYINSIVTGQPINILTLQQTFVSSVSSVITANLVTRLLFSVYINSTLTAPTAGTDIILGDPESYFETNSTLITINQG